MKPRVFVPAVLSALLLWTAFFPLDLGPVAFVALVPFATLVRAEGVSRRRRYLAAFVGGLVFFGLALKWVRVAHPLMALFAWPGLTLYCACFWPLTLFAIRRADRLGLPLALSLPLGWIAVEYLRAHAPTGFPFLRYVSAYQLAGFGWYFLGHTQHRFLPLVGVADLGGVYAVSAIVAAVNAAVYEWTVRVPAVRRWLRWDVAWRPPEYFREMWVSAGVFLVLVGGSVYGMVMMAHPKFADGVRVAAIQASVPQNEKSVTPDGTGSTPLDRAYRPLAKQAGAGDGRTATPDLVIWPETCVADAWYDVPADAADPKVRDQVARYRRELGTDIAALTRCYSLLGLNGLTHAGGDRWARANSAVLIKPDGSAGGRYDKMHLVPFGEYVPFRQRMPWLQKLTPYEGDYSCVPGDEYTRFTLTAAADEKPYTFGVLICYEDSDPYLARQYNPWSGRPGVDFLVNMSNDGWFDGTEEHEQHLAICRFRAVEARRPIVRAVNMGISAVIDSDGRILALPRDESWAGSKKVAAVVRAALPVDPRGSYYAWLGDWLPAIGWAAVAAGVVSGRLWRRVSGVGCRASEKPSS